MVSRDPHAARALGSTAGPHDRLIMKVENGSPVVTPRAPALPKPANSPVRSEVASWLPRAWPCIRRVRSTSGAGGARR